LKKWLFALLVCLLIIACSNKNKPKLIPKKDLIVMMVDLNVCDAFSLDSYVVSQLGGLDSATIYSSFFAKHKYNKQDFDYTLQYYSNKPKKLIAIYDAVFAELSKKSDELKALSENFSYGGMQDIWRHKGNFPGRSDTLIKIKDNYEILLDSVGTYVITAQIKMTTADQSVNPRITAYYFDPKNPDPEKRKYFKKTIIIKSDYFREYQLYEKNENPQYRRLHIILPDRDNKDTLYNKSVQLSSFTVSILRKDIDNKEKK
jgi:hypothetical protein